MKMYWEKTHIKSFLMFACQLCLNMALKITTSKQDWIQLKAQAQSIKWQTGKINDEIKWTKYSLTTRESSIQFLEHGMFCVTWYHFKIVSCVSVYFTEKSHFDFIIPSRIVKIPKCAEKGILRLQQLQQRVFVI